MSARQPALIWSMALNQITTGASIQFVPFLAHKTARAGEPKQRDLMAIRQPVSRRAAAGAIACFGHCPRNVWSPGFSRPLKVALNIVWIQYQVAFCRLKPGLHTLRLETVFRLFGRRSTQLKQGVNEIGPEESQPVGARESE